MSTGINIYLEAFINLADIICEFPAICQTSHFVFVPGPNDPWGDVLSPRPAIPKSFTERIRNKVKRSFFTTNPCRIKFCTQEIVVMRDNLLSKMSRHAAVKTNTDTYPHLYHHVCDIS